MQGLGCAAPPRRVAVRSALLATPAPASQLQLPIPPPLRSSRAAVVALSPPLEGHAAAAPELWAPRASADARFRALVELNSPDARRALGLGVLPGAAPPPGHSRRHTRLNAQHAALFPGDGAYSRLARAVAAARCVDGKEFVESVELFALVRRRVRRPTLLDLCAGHGLVGLLFAAFEPAVRRVLCVDVRQPGSHAALLAAVASVAPWAADKVEFLQASVQQAAAGAELSAAPRGSCGVVAAHACGALTDECLRMAVGLGAPMALLPCCYTGTAAGAPRAARRLLGDAAAADCERARALEAAGYEVAFDALPRSITALNRVLVATPRGGVRLQPQGG